MFKDIKRVKSMIRAEIEHEHEMKMESKEASFKREKDNWEEDKKRDKDHAEREHDLQLKESITLARLENEQKLKQLDLLRWTTWKNSPKRSRNLLKRPIRRFLSL